MTTWINSLILKSSECTLLRKLSTANLNRVITIKISNKVCLEVGVRAKVGQAINLGFYF